MPETPALSARSVDLRRSGRLLLDGVELTVRAGERWALLGPNGAGKSTLLAVLAGRLHPTSGTVHLLGERLGRVDVRELWPRIGLVQGAHLPVEQLTTRQVVLTGAYGTAALPRRTLPRTADLDRVEALIDLLGLRKVAGSPWPALSTGELRRTLLARALLPAPPVLLLDEPASGLDLPAREALVDALDDLAAGQPGLASVLVTHHLEEVPASTTHALLLRDGRVLAAGPARQVLVEEPLSACFGLPLVVGQVEGRWTAHGRR